MKKIIIAVAIAASMTSQPLMAAVYSSSSLTNFIIELIDLDLEDGITPSVTFGPTGSSKINGDTSVGSDGNFGPATDEFQKFANNTNSISDSANDGFSISSASLVSNGPATTSLEVSGSTLGAVGFGSFGAYNAFSSDILNYTLSGNTKLIISADANLYVQNTSSGEFVLSNAQIYLYNILNNNRGSDNFDTQQLLIYGSQLEDKTLQRTLSVFIDNFDLVSSKGNFEANIVASGSSYDTKPPSSVPVPAALPLMASALGIFGLARRRNKSKAA